MKINKVITVIIALVIIVGIIVTLTTGFNVDMVTREHEQILLKLGKEYEITDIKEMANEVFKDQTIDIQKAGEFEEDVLIRTDNISDEQKKDLVSKINEKYETEIEADEAQIVTIPKTNLSGILTSYIWTFVIATILIVVYFAIRYKKLGLLKAILQPLLVILITEMVTFSAIAITRITIGQNLLSIVFVVYAIAVFVSTTIFENKLQKLKLEEAKKEKKQK